MTQSQRSKSYLLTHDGLVAQRRSGYIRKNKVGNTLYTEYTGLRGYTKNIENQRIIWYINKEGFA